MSASGWLEKGYRILVVNGRRIREHVMVAERALGRTLPAGAVIHHADENRQNNAPANLVICPDNSYHKLLHVRMRARDACGNPNWRLCTFCGKHDDPANMRGEKSGRFVHSACSATANRLRLRRKNGEPETVASRAVAACGQAHWRKCWICKTYSDPATMKECRRPNGTGYFYHSACHNARGAANYLRKKEARNVNHV